MNCAGAGVAKNRSGVPQRRPFCCPLTYSRRHQSKRAPPRSAVASDRVRRHGHGCVKNFGSIKHALHDIGVHRALDIPESHPCRPTHFSGNQIAGNRQRESRRGGVNIGADCGSVESANAAVFNRYRLICRSEALEKLHSIPESLGGTHAVSGDQYSHR